MEHKPQSLRVKAVERLLGQLRQEGRLVVKPVVTHPPKLPYKRHNPNETGLKRYELKGGRYLIRSNEPRRNRKCKNIDCEHLRQNRGDDHQHEAASDTCDEESVQFKPDNGSSETSEFPSITNAPDTSTTSSVTSNAVTTDSSALTTNSNVKIPVIERRPELVATTSSLALGPSQNHHHHHHNNPSQNQHSEDDGQALFFQTDHSMFYLSSLEDGFLTEEITEHI